MLGIDGFVGLTAISSVGHNKPGKCFCPGSIQGAPIAVAVCIMSLFPFGILKKVSLLICQYVSYVWTPAINIIL